MKRIIIAAFATFSICLTAAGQQAMPSLLISSDPVTLSHGGSSVALKADAFAVENNTAAMSFYEGRMDAGASYAVWQPTELKSSVVGVGAFGKIGKKFAVGVSLKFLTQPSVSVVDESGITPQLKGSFTPKESCYCLGGSYLITPCISAGVNVKLANSSLSSQAKATSFAADVYAALKTRFGLSAGLGVCNLSGKVNYGGEQSYSLPALLRAGASYSIKGVTADAELDYLFSGAVMACVSAGYWFKDWCGASIGYHYGKDNAASTQEGAVAASSMCIPSYLSIGIGGKFKGVHIDAAYLLGSSAVKNSLCLSLGYSF